MHGSFRFAGILLVISASAALAQPPAGDATADDDAIARISDRIVRKVHERYEQTDGGAITEMLVATGVSAADSDRIARAFFDGLLSCLLDAAESQAREQSIPLEDVLLAFEQAFEAPVFEEPTIVDMTRIDQKAESCAFAEMQKAGITFEMMIRPRPVVP